MQLRRRVGWSLPVAAVVFGGIASSRTVGMTDRGVKDRAATAVPLAESTVESGEVPDDGPYAARWDSGH